MYSWLLACWNNTTRALAVCFVLSSVAGLFGALAKKLSLRDTLIAAGISGVGGVVVGLLGLYALGEKSNLLIFAMCGIAGWAGGNIVLDRLTFVAWTIARGKLPPGVTLTPEEKESHASIDPAPARPAGDAGVHDPGHGRVRRVWGRPPLAEAERGGQQGQP